MSDPMAVFNYVIAKAKSFFFGGGGLSQTALYEMAGAIFIGLVVLCCCCGATGYVAF